MLYVNGLKRLRWKSNSEKGEIGSNFTLIQQRQYDFL